MQAEDITIAVTVYSRREFVLEAIRSALQQTIPVRVVVVEDCGPDPALRDFVLGEFGTRIEYIRNTRNRGLFDNWNACLDYCRSPWISILHDDDLLRPGFVESMLKMAEAAPGRALYFGRVAVLSGTKTEEPPPPVGWIADWRDLDVVEMADQNPSFFAGQLLNIEAVRSLGGFRAASYFTGDWDMWFRLALRFGAAQTKTTLALMRSHEGDDRGTSRVERKGWKWALDNVQRKRNHFHLRREKSISVPFNRVKFLQSSPIPSRLLLRHAAGFSDRILRYNAWLFTQSGAPRPAYAALQNMVRWFGPSVLRMGSAIYRAVGKAV